MTTYEIFTDEIPLGHVNYGDFIELVTKQEVRPQRPDQAHDLSNPIWGLAKQCWVKDPKERPTAIAVSDVIAQLQDAHTKHRKESRKEEARHKEADAQRSKEVVISTEEGWRIREAEVNRREEEIERKEQNVQCKETEAQRKAEETQKLVIQLVMKEDECRRKEAHLRRREEIVERKELEAQRRMEEAETMKKGVVMIEAKIERREEGWEEKQTILQEEFRKREDITLRAYPPRDFYSGLVRPLRLNPLGQVVPMTPHKTPLQRQNNTASKAIPEIWKPSLSREEDAIMSQTLAIARRMPKSSPEFTLVIRRDTG